MRTIRDPLASHNERVRLFATFVNAIGLGLIGIAVLGPLSADIANATVATLYWGVTGVAMHGAAHYVLRYLRKETSS